MWRPLIIDYVDSSGPTEELNLTLGSEATMNVGYQLKFKKADTDVFYYHGEVKTIPA